MNLKFLATGQSPDFYTMDGEVITAHYQGETQALDFSQLETGDEFEGLETELPLPPQQIVRAAYRDDEGELHLTLCQASGNGDWTESQIIDATEYVQGRQYIRRVVNGEPVENVYPVEEPEDA